MKKAKGTEPLSKRQIAILVLIAVFLVIYFCNPKSQYSISRADWETQYSISRVVSVVCQGEGVPAAGDYRSGNALKSF